MGKRALEGNLGYKGERGYSAYEIAVLNGYEGTEQEWIDHFGLDLTGYLKTTDVVDDLEHEYTTRPLSAKQGKQLETDINYVDSIKIDKAEYYLLTGTITTPESGGASLSTTLNLDYPTGFTKDNCVIVSVMSNLASSQDGYWKYIFSSQPDVFDLGYLIPYAKLISTGITVGIKKYDASMQSSTVKFRILLMKINNIQSI